MILAYRNGMMVACKVLKREVGKTRIKCVDEARPKWIHNDDLNCHLFETVDAAMDWIDVCEAEKSKTKVAASGGRGSRREAGCMGAVLEELKALKEEVALLRQSLGDKQRGGAGPVALAILNHNGEVRINGLETNHPDFRDLIDGKVSEVQLFAGRSFEVGGEPVAYMSSRNAPYFMSKKVANMILLRGASIEGWTPLFTKQGSEV